MGNLDKLANIGAQLGISYAVEITNELKDFEKFIIQQLKARLKDTQPRELKYAFRDNLSIYNGVDSNELKNLMSYVKSDDPRILKIKANIQKHMYYFDQYWALETLRKELPDFYSIIMTDAEPERFKAWFSSQIQDILKQVNELFSSNS